jgi:hypothetical protein
VGDRYGGTRGRRWRRRRGEFAGAAGVPPAHAPEHGVRRCP